MQKHLLLLHSSFSMSPFKVHLCCLVHESVFSEVLPAGISRLVYQYVIDQIDVSTIWNNQIQYENEYVSATMKYSYWSICSTNLLCISRKPKFTVFSNMPTNELLFSNLYVFLISDEAYVCQSFWAKWWTNYPRKELGIVEEGLANEAHLILARANSWLSKRGERLLGKARGRSWCSGESYRDDNVDDYLHWWNVHLLQLAFVEFKVKHN